MQLTSNGDLITIEQHHSLLLSQEMRLESQDQGEVDIILPTTAFLSTKASSSQSCGQPSNRSHFHGRGRGKGNFNRPSSSNSNNLQDLSMPQSQQRAPCQIFNKINHSALDCFYRMDHSYQRRQPPARLVVMAAARIQPGLWYTDTGATNHVTSDLSILSLHLNTKEVIKLPSVMVMV